MPVEADVHFLNIDLLLIGRFDRRPLLAALRNDAFVLQDDVKFDGKDCLILQVLAPGLDFSRTLTPLLTWAQGLPPAARRSWAAAARRVFDIGLQAGLKPNDSHWSISREQTAALARLRAEVVLTVYGANLETRVVARRPARRRSP
jgi:hypothetical protein